MLNASRLTEAIAYSGRARSLFPKTFQPPRCAGVRVRRPGDGVA
jgi:hypothetical protein